MFLRRDLARRRGSQVVRQRSAKPLFSGSNPLRASNNLAVLPAICSLFQRFAASPGNRGESQVKLGPDLARKAAFPAVHGTVATSDEQGRGHVKELAEDPRLLLTHLTFA